MAKAAKNMKDKGLGGLSPRGKSAVRCPDEARLLRSCETLRRQIRPMTEPERAMYVATREAAELLSADDFCFAVVTPGVLKASVLTSTGVKESWDCELLAKFARGEQREPPDKLALARVKRRGRAWGAVALRWDHAEISWDLRNALTRYMRHANDVIADIERDRLLEVRGKIDRKIMEQLRSRDLFYQILDGLRSLTGYDHSATVLIGERDQSVFEIAAEKLAWRHGKSHRVGQAVDVPSAELQALHAGGVTGFMRRDGQFTQWKTDAPAHSWLGNLLAQPCTRSGQEPPIGEALVGPLATRDGLRAVLIVSAIHPGLLGEYEAELVSSFLPQVSISLQNSRWAEAVEAEMLETERKHAMADLARGVAHDVNNALGATIPLLQQVQHDLSEGRLDPAALAQDIEQVQRSVQVCRDIFGGMVRFARTAARPQGTASVRAAIENAQMILRAGLRRRTITVRLELADHLPELGMSQAELEQLLMNLMNNAVDAMEAGGELAIVARVDEEFVCIDVADTGAGIAPDVLKRIQDPFFSTKAHGSGLGLSICRSIVWRTQGEMTIESIVGKGTRVKLELPVAALEASRAAEIETLASPRSEAAIEEHAHPGD